MAPMQWRDATVGGKDTTGFEAFSSQIRQEPDVRQVQVGNIGQTGEVSVATQNQFMVAGPVDSPVVASPVVEARWLEARWWQARWWQARWWQAPPPHSR